MAMRWQALPNHDLIIIPPARDLGSRRSGNYQDLVPPCVPEFDAATSFMVPRRLTSGLLQTFRLLLLVITGLLLRVGTPRVAPVDNAWQVIALQPELAKCPIT